ncbi:hypothetical protein D3C71_1601310 [compost metagenome]
MTGTPLSCVKRVAPCCTISLPQGQKAKVRGETAWACAKPGNGQPVAASPAAPANPAAPRKRKSRRAGLASPSKGERWGMLDFLVVGTTTKRGCSDCGSNVM